MRDVDLSIVIPAFNEADRLPPTLRLLDRFLSQQPHTWEIVISDDGSTDGTQELCRDCLSDRAPLFVRAGRHRGKGHAVRLGMMAARGAIRVMYDADHSMPPEELPKLIDPLSSGAAHVAIGSRYLDGSHAQGQPLWRRAWSRLAHSVVRKTLVPGIRDTHCGYKAFTAQAAQDIFSRVRLKGWTFDLEVLALASRLGHPIVEVSVQWMHDHRSRVRPWRDLPLVIAETMRLLMALRTVPVQGRAAGRRAASRSGDDDPPGGPRDHGQRAHVDLVPAQPASGCSRRGAQRAIRQSRREIARRR